MPRSPRGPRTGRPRSRCAARTRTTDSARCGAKVSATTTATPTSYSAAGRIRTSRAGWASALAAPKQATSTASRSPATKALSSASAVTGPPSDSPPNQDGSGAPGRRNRMWPG